MRDLVTVRLRWVKDMFRMDMYRVVHGKTFYILVASIIYILFMMVTQMHDTNSLTAFIGGSSDSFLSAGMDLSMTNIMTGILLSIYIGREFTTGMVKNIVTTHANKLDYIISKAMTGLVCNIAFMFIYIVTLLVLGMVQGLPLEIGSAVGFILFLIEKLALSIPMSLLIITMNLLLRRNYGWSIILSYVFCTGSIVNIIKMLLHMMGLDMVGNVYNFTISGAANFVSLTPNIIYFLIILAVSVAWTLFWGLVGDMLMNYKDIL